MTRKLICGVSALAMLLSAPRTALAVYAGSVVPDAPVLVEVAAPTGTTAVTITELGNERVRSVISLTVPFNEVQQVQLTPTRSTRRFVIEIDLPQGTSAGRIRVLQQGAPVFPDETFAEDRRYVVDVR